jgi:hypothetical protein
MTSIPTRFARILITSFPVWRLTRLTLVWQGATSAGPTASAHRCGHNQNDGYYPMRLSLDRIFAELPNVPFRDHVWALFLRDNAMRIFKVGVRG